MKKQLCLFVFGLFLTANVLAQTIQDVQAFGKTDGSRFVALLSDQTIWWYAENTGWQKVSASGLPPGSGIKYFNSYVKFGMGNKNTRLVAVLQDNSMWWYSEGAAWEKIPATGLPKNGAIKIFRPYVKTGAMGNAETRFVVILEDNSIWWYANGEEWKSVSSTGLPAGHNIRFLGSYQKVAMMGTDTRYIVTLSDNTVWWYADNSKKWQQIEAKGLPAQHQFKQFETYTKMGGLMGNTFEGRLVGVLSDESIWWLAANGREWKKLDTDGLPKDYKIRSLKVYQKHPGLMGETRVIVVLEDNSIWWYAEGKKWLPVSLNGLSLSR